MAKHPPRRRPKSEDSPKPPRPRLAEIQAEIHDVQQQIEQLRRAARVIRDAQDVRAWERAGPSRLFRKFLLITDFGEPCDNPRVRPRSSSSGATRDGIASH